MSYRRVVTLGEAVDHGVLLEITCTNADCGRRRVVAPYELLARFTASTRIAQLGRRLVCRGVDLAGGGCGRRGAIVRFILRDGPPDPEPPTSGGGNVIPFTRRRFEPDEAEPRPIRRAARHHRRAQKMVPLRDGDATEVATAQSQKTTQKRQFPLSGTLEAKWDDPRPTFHAPVSTAKRRPRHRATPKPTLFRP